MAHTKVNQQNLQFIGHQNFDHQHFEKKVASIDRQPAEWMKSYKDKAAAIKKEIMENVKSHKEILKELNVR